MSIEKFLAWVRKHWLLVIVILLIAPLLSTHILFKISLGIDFVAAEWSAGDLLGYFAGFYAFIGTVLLGLVTVEQSKKAQEINERLSKENNYLQKVASQRLMPIIKASLVDSRHSEKIFRPPNNFNGQVIVSERVTPENRELFVDVFLPNTRHEELQVKPVVLSLENISEGVIRQISVERVEFSGFAFCGEKVDLAICYGIDKYKYISYSLLPHDKIEVTIRVYYSDSRYTKFWEGLGEFDICLYLKNTSISDIVCQEKVYIKKAEGFQERIMYRTFEDEQKS